MGDLAETVQIAARVPVELRDALERIGEDQDRNLSWLVRQALKAYVAEQDQDAA